MTEKLEFEITFGSPSELYPQPEKLDFTKPVAEFFGYKEEIDEGSGTKSVEPKFPESKKPRGLAIKSIEITSKETKWWQRIEIFKEVYFITIAFDFSGIDPLILPPSSTSTYPMTYKVQQNGKISFDLGDGAPLFPARTIVGGLVIYVIVVESDKGVRHVGKVMSDVHGKLKGKGSLVEKVEALVKNPATTAMYELLATMTSVLAPIATILENHQDDFLGLFDAYYSVNSEWKENLTQNRPGISIELEELS